MTCYEKREEWAPISEFIARHLIVRAHSLTIKDFTGCVTVV